jgi:hypothetical protein
MILLFISCFGVVDDPILSKNAVFGNLRSHNRGILLAGVLLLTLFVILSLEQIGFLWVICMFISLLFCKHLLPLGLLFLHQLPVKDMELLETCYLVWAQP